MSLQGFYTTKGLALAAKAAAGAGLTVTRVTAGSGATAASAAALAEEKQTLTVGPAQTDGQTATLPVTLAEAKSGASYTLTELGVYADDPDEGEILYQVFRLDESRAIRAGGESVYRFYLRQSVGADGVTVACSPAGLLVDEDLAPTRGKVLAVRVPSRTVEIELSALQSYLDSLPKLLTDNLTIKVSGTWSGTITIHGFYGSGLLRIAGSEGCTLTGAVHTACCTVVIELLNIVLQAPQVMSGGDFLSNGLLFADHSYGLWVQGCSFVGNGAYPGVVGYISSKVCLVDSPISNCAAAVYSCASAEVSVFNSASVAYSDNNIGAFVYRGGIILLGENTPDTLGAAANSHSGGIIAKPDGTLI